MNKGESTTQANLDTARTIDESGGQREEAMNKEELREQYRQNQIKRITSENALPVLMYSEMYSEWLESRLVEELAATRPIEDKLREELELMTHDRDGVKLMNDKLRAELETMKEAVQLIREAVTYAGENDWLTKMEDWHERATKFLADSIASEKG